MKGWLVEEFGGPEMMKWVELPETQLKEGEALVEVRASGVNFAETRMLAGTYTGLETPIVLGLEYAGIVEAVGPGGENFKPGDRVLGRARGSHAEKVFAPVDRMMHLPETLSFEEGAAVPVGWHTAWHALLTVAKAYAGQRVLIEAAASSVGSAALQIAKYLECWVAVTASRDDKLQTAAEYGADLLINYKTESIRDRIMKETGGLGLDVACMTIGEETADQVISSLGDDGKGVMYGSTGGRQVCFDLGIGHYNIQLLSMSIDTSNLYISETVRTFRQRALPLFENGHFKAVVDTVLPIGDVAKAHEMINDRRHYGKVILKVG